MLMHGHLRSCIHVYNTKEQPKSHNIYSISDFEYKTMVAHAEEIIASLSKDPEGLADSLFTKGMISSDTLEAIKSQQSTDKARRLYSALLAVVQENPQRYGEFLMLLREHGQLYIDLLDLLSEIPQQKGII